MADPHRTVREARPLTRALAASILFGVAAHGGPAAAQEIWENAGVAKQAILDCMSAQDDHTACLDVVASACLDVPANQSNQGMIRCMDVSHSAWDSLLNDAFRAAMEQLDADAQTALRQAQRSWIAFRDDGCAVWMEVYRGGSMARLIAADCLREKTAQRTLDLQAIADAASL